MEMFVTIEGIEGSGKSTIANLLAEILSLLFPDKAIMKTAEPTSLNRFGVLANKFLRKEITTQTPWEQALYFLRDRAFHVENEIIPFLSKGGIVVCDRYTHSQLAYQTVDGIPLDDLIFLNERFPIPDIVVFVSVPVEIAISRVYARTPEKDREVYDHPQLLSRVDKVYRRLFREKVLLREHLVINGVASLEENKEVLLNFFSEFAKRRPHMGEEQFDMRYAVRLINNIIEAALADCKEPFLSHARLARDFEKINQLVERKVNALAIDELERIFPLLLSLQGYTITGKKEIEKQVVWEISFMDPVGIPYKGAGVLVKNVEELPALQKWVHRWRYDFAIYFLLEEDTTVSNSTGKHVNILTKSDVVCHLTALTIERYLDTFAFTISSMPGMKAHFLSLVEQGLGISGRRLQEIWERWHLLSQ